MRNVAIVENNLVRYLSREWFPKSIAEICKHWSATAPEVMPALETLVRNREVVRFMHPVRQVTVYTVPSNPQAPK